MNIQGDIILEVAKMSPKVRTLLKRKGVLPTPSNRHLSTKSKLSNLKKSLKYKMLTTK